MKTEPTDYLAYAMRSCISGTAVACRALSLRGVTASPLSVRVTVANDDCLVLGVGFTERELMRLCRNHPNPAAYVKRNRRAERKRNPDGWQGHLVAWLPNSGSVLDMTLGQFARPDYGFAPPEQAPIAVGHEFATGGYSYEIAVGPCNLSYRARVPDDGSWHFYYRRMDAAIIDDCARRLLAQRESMLTTFCKRLTGKVFGVRAKKS